LKKLISLFVIGFLILSGIGSFASKIYFDHNFHNINLIDDAFHGTTPYPSMEWWYFDSIFDNDYSIHIGFRILSFNEFQMLKTSINIYYKYNLLANETKLISKNNFFASEKKPIIKIENEPVMLVDQSNETNDEYWTYHVNYKINNVGVDLIFIIQVNGTGYHDHNWNFGLKTPARGWAWYWGKIRGNHFCFSWANIKKTGILEQTFLEKIGVLNIVNGSFDVIDVENISITANSFIIKNFRLIPTEFQIYVEQNDLLIDVNLKTVSIHRTDPSALTIHYWRYFVKISGIIKKDNIIDELIDIPHIIEYMRFV